jgi:hypothetical protein
MREAAEALLLQAAGKSRKERRLEFRPRLVVRVDKVDLLTVQLTTIHSAIQVIGLPPNDSAKKAKE